ncbi:PTS sugar transporter subunit IIC [Xylocopilactobacillus apicola]|uniref:Permease IIC component n=1 Tax=Xylocopilactobacillus apicola TaxID=2932184 RepID=A0AAU9DV59_9LACO|nr:PTS transporter subunit EIIC [Xylocopilactobacillus apicola]BDR57753.1 permease IIC component [Xylocopilactobacillus apicola]
METKVPFTDKLTAVMGKFSSNLIIKSIANGMIKILPVTMVGSICAILSNLGIPAYQKFIDHAGITPLIKIGSTMTTDLISVYVLIALSYEMSSLMKSDLVASILISVMSFFILTPLGVFNGKVNAIEISYLGSKGMFVAMIVALCVTWFYHFLTKKNITIKMPDNVPPSIANSFTSLIPGIIIGAITLLVSGCLKFTSFGNIHDLIYTVLQTPLKHLGSSIWTLLFLMFFSEFLWFFGIHGSLTTSAILYTLYQPLEMQNLAAYTAGKALPNIMTMSFINTLKGPRHFALALLLLMVCHSKHLKEVGKIAIVPGFFGISEPMKFGIPMVLNPVLFIPMCLAPVMSIAIAYISTVLNLIPRANGVTFPWNIPFLSGLVIGDWRTGLLQIVQMILIMLLYYPFIKFLNRQSLKEEKLS